MGDGHTQQPADGMLIRPRPHPRCRSGRAARRPRWGVPGASVTISLECPHRHLPLIDFPTHGNPHGFSEPRCCKYQPWLWTNCQTGAAAAAGCPRTCRLGGRMLGLCAALCRVSSGEAGSQPRDLGQNAQLDPLCSRLSISLLS